MGLIFSSAGAHTYLKSGQVAPLGMAVLSFSKTIVAVEWKLLDTF